MSEQKWDPKMTGVTFVDVSKPYFDMKGLWNLHEGICLLAKINPKSKTPIVGENADTNESDPTIRYYKYALEAIQMAKGNEGAHVPSEKLQVLKDDPTQVGAKQLFFNPRSFVKWAIDRWPDKTSHLKLAEEQYQKTKFLSGSATKDDTDTWSKLSREEKEGLARKIFFQMAQEKKLKLGASKGKVRLWGRLLNSRMSESIKKPYKGEKLRKLIPDWIDPTQN